MCNKMTHQHPGRQARSPGPPLVAERGLGVDMTHKHFGLGGIEAKPLGYEIINLGGGRNPISLQTGIAFIEKALGKSASIAAEPVHVADVTETWADISKAARLLGWAPRVSREEGFRTTVDWHVRNREWLKSVVV